jgi:NAD(P)-dependent dehydrogenase (short-subunit alcohol dehydrogenase family)
VSGSTSVRYGLADLENLDAVRAFARGFRATHDRLDALIHNAGAIHPEFRTDGAGTELTILGQVVAPFLLTTLLMPALLAAAPSRVITVSSGGMYTQRLDPGTLQLPASHYQGVTAYARANRAQVALSREWARRLAGTGVAFHAMHPGWADTPGVAAALPGFHRITRPICSHPSREPTRSSGWPPRLTRGWAAAGSGTTGAPGPNTRCRGRARKTPVPHANSGTIWPRRPPRTHPKLAQAGRDSVAVEHDIPAQGQR